MEVDKDKETSNEYDIKGKENTLSTSKNKGKEIAGHVCMSEYCRKLHSI